MRPFVFSNVSSIGVQNRKGLSELRMGGGGEGATTTPPDFARSVNPIIADDAPPHY